MTQTKTSWIFGTLVMFVAAGCYGVGVTGGRCCPDDAGGSSSAGKLPANVWAAAVAAVPGLVLDEWDSETHDGKLVYDVEGSAYGKAFELEITADGMVLEVEEEKADGQHDDGDDDKDDDGGDDDGEHDDDDK